MKKLQSVFWKAFLNLVLGGLATPPMVLWLHVFIANGFGMLTCYTGASRVSLSSCIIVSHCKALSGAKNCISREKERAGDVAQWGSAFLASMEFRVWSPAEYASNLHTPGVEKEHRFKIILGYIVSGGQPGLHRPPPPKKERNRGFEDLHSHRLPFYQLHPLPHLLPSKTCSYELRLLTAPEDCTNEYKDMLWGNIPRSDGVVQRTFSTYESCEILVSSAV